MDRDIWTFRQGEGNYSGLQWAQPMASFFYAIGIQWPPCQWPSHRLLAEPLGHWVDFIIDSPLSNALAGVSGVAVRGAHQQRSVGPNSAAAAVHVYPDRRSSSLFTGAPLT